MNVELWIKVTCGSCGFSYCVRTLFPDPSRWCQPSCPVCRHPAMTGGMDQRTKNEPAFVMVNEK